MKMTPEMSRAQQRMKPGVITSAGFLGTDQRNIAEIIAEDEIALSVLGVSFEEVVAKMKELRDKATGGLGETITVHPFWEVRVDEARGVLPCPFSDGICRKINTYVKDLATGKEFFYSDLTIHLIQVHHFFQGTAAPFRHDPQEYSQVLHLIQK